MDLNVSILALFAAFFVCGLCEKDERKQLVWTILCLASLVNLAANLTFFDYTEDYSKAIGWASIDFATMWALTLLPMSMLALRQFYLVLAQWLTNSILYLDLITGASIVYDRYEFAILAIAALQVSLGFPGIHDAIRNRLATRSHTASAGDMPRANALESNEKSVKKPEIRNAEA